ncbi:hypothetical protein D3C76_970710 [compost metagenome]
MVEYPGPILYRSCWFQMTSLPVFGIGNGSPPRQAGSTASPSLWVLQAVALRTVASNTSFGYAVVRWLG